MYVNAKNVTYFNSFGVEHIPKEIIKLIENKYITTNICRIKALDSTMCGYFCIEFTDFMLKSKILLPYTYSFSRNDYDKMTK